MHGSALYNPEAEGMRVLDVKRQGKGKTCNGVVTRLRNKK